MFKKKTNFIIVIVAILLISALLPIFITIHKNNNKNKNKSDNVVITEVGLDIVNYDIQFEQYADSINLLSGEIVTNYSVDNVFININNCGCEDLTFSQSKNSSGYNVIIITPTNRILDLIFGLDSKVVADIYVVFSNRSFKVSSKRINIRSSLEWTDNV